MHAPITKNCTSGSFKSQDNLLLKSISFGQKELNNLLTRGANPNRKGRVCAFASFKSVAGTVPTK
jgi:hypothetical protein